MQPLSNIVAITSNSLYRLPRNRWRHSDILSRSCNINLGSARVSLRSRPCETLYSFLKFALLVSFAVTHKFDFHKRNKRPGIISKNFLFLGFMIYDVSNNFAANIRIATFRRIWMHSEISQTILSLVFYSRFHIYFLKNEL